MRLFRILSVGFVACVLVITAAYESIPTANTQKLQFDVIIVLGNPANPDGTLAPEQRERVLEGIREYRAGVASRLIMTGGAAHNSHVEAHVMAEYAVKQGVAASAVIEEVQAQNTIENIYYSAQIMKEHGWLSAEIVSSPSHLPRSSLILRTFDRVQPTLAIDWSTHASRWPNEYGLLSRFEHYFVEANYCMLLRIRGFTHSRFLPV